MNRSKEHDPKLETVDRFFTGTGATYDLVVNLATLGIDRRWKRRIAEHIPANARRVLDLACGTGISTLAIANRHPECQVVGVELREEYLAVAREKIRRFKIPNIEFVLSRAEDYRSEEPFDCVVSSYLAKYAYLDQLTQNTKAMLKEGGLLLMHDFTYPPSSLVWIWRIYFWVLQHLGTPLLPAWREIYYGLPKVIQETQWVSELTAALQTYSFHNIHREDLTAYGSAIITATK